MAFFDTLKRWLGGEPRSQSVPDGWTDDMSIDLAAPHTLDELVDFVLEAERRGVAPAETIRELQTRFALSEGDAELAWDRSLGGLVRAATGNPANCPNQKKDPVAWISHQRCLNDPALIAAIRR